MIKIKPLIVILSIFILCTNLSCNDDDDHSGNYQLNVSSTKKINDFISSIEDNDRGMGGVSIFKGDQQIYSRSYGYADIDTKLKANNNTIYKIGSVSKTFTATVIMRLIEEKKLTLDTKLSKFYPQIPNSNQITIEYLLRHKSGVIDFTSDPDYLTWYTKPQTKDYLINRLTLGSDFPPGTQTLYCNSNYLLLAYIAEDVSNQTYSDLIKKYISIPCKLSRTGEGDAINIHNNEANSYLRAGNGWKLDKETDKTVSIGAGSIATTAYELNVFYNNLFSCKIVSKNSLNLMKEIINGYGLGLTQFNADGEIGIGHRGAIDGFYTAVFYYPQYGVTISILTNASNYFVDDMMKGIVSIYLNKPFDLPVFKKPLDLKSEDLDKYLGNYTSQTFPYPITVSKRNNILVVNIAGLLEYEPICYEPNVFVYESLGAVFTFIPQENKMRLFYGQQEYIYNKVNK